MKKLFLLLFVATFVLFTSCEKEIFLSSLEIDLQNSYWESNVHSDPTHARTIIKFNTSTMISYGIEGSPFCVFSTDTRNYTLEGNELRMEGRYGIYTVEIQDDILKLEEGNSGYITYDRKPTLEYPDC